MRLLLVHSFLLAIGIACASVSAYGLHVQQPYGIATAASAAYTGLSSHDDVTSTLLPLPNVSQPNSFGVQLQTEKANGVGQVEVLSPGAALVFLSGKVFAESDPMLLVTEDESKDVTDTSTGGSQVGGVDGANGLAHALPSVGRALIAVFTFACLETLLTYAVTGKTPLALVSSRTKSARY